MTTAPKPRRIAELSITNVLAIEQAQLSGLEKGLVLEGRMGSGKTSILDALGAAVAKHARTKMVRRGAEEGDILMVFDDGTRVERKITDGKVNAPVVTDPTGKRITAPAAFLNSLMPALNLNPVSFVQMEPAKQAALLSEIFPVSVDFEELKRVTRGLVDLSQIPPGLNGLETATFVRRLAEQQRIELNGAVRQVTNTIEVERRRIPSEFDPDAVRSQSSQQLAQQLSELNQFNSNYDALVNKREETRREMDEIRAKIAELTSRLGALETREQQFKVFFESNQRKDTEELRRKIDSYDQQRTTLGHFDNLQKALSSQGALTAQAEEMAQVVAELKKLPARLVERAKIPIPGLTLEDGRILIDGLPLDNLSEGEQLRVAVRVAAAGAKDLKVVCIDGAERLADSDFEFLLNELEANDFQVFCTRVADKDLTVRNLDGGVVEGAYRVAPQRDSLQESFKSPALVAGKQSVRREAVAPVAAKPATPPMSTATAQEEPALELPDFSL